MSTIISQFQLGLHLLLIMKVRLGEIFAILSKIVNQNKEHSKMCKEVGMACQNYIHKVKQGHIKVYNTPHPLFL